MCVCFLAKEENKGEKGFQVCGVPFRRESAWILLCDRRHLTLYCQGMATSQQQGEGGVLAKGGEALV